MPSPPWRVPSTGQHLLPSARRVAGRIPVVIPSLSSCRRTRTTGNDETTSSLLSKRKPGEQLDGCAKLLDAFERSPKQTGLLLPKVKHQLLLRLPPGGKRPCDRLRPCHDTSLKRITTTDRYARKSSNARVTSSAWVQGMPCEPSSSTTRRLPLRASCRRLPVAGKGRMRSASPE